ncbi:FDXHR family putative zinc-binding protein [Micromonospora carbonacea]|uniref:Phage FDXHR zinc binding domain-containing protein n=1 Tax=Micromonospora carbonacea TaxID=47853 RepID=A0A1C5A9L1_9ACTN|nr:hypothetical protein [Micromonospora carbonacea]SCF41885.1 hypothetical protein GA0070563_11211 [Micromonospora carbonacea]
MPCPTTCTQPTPAQAHCSVCHHTFGGVTGFDSHRRDGTCLDPATLGFVQRDGVWRAPMSDDARERFARLNTHTED